MAGSLSWLPMFVALVGLSYHLRPRPCPCRICVDGRANAEQVRLNRAALARHRATLAMTTLPSRN